MFVSAFSFASVVCFAVAYIVPDGEIAAGFCFVGIVYQVVCLTLIGADVAEMLKQASEGK